MRRLPVALVLAVVLPVLLTARAGQNTTITLATSGNNSPSGTPITVTAKIDPRFSVPTYQRSAEIPLSDVHVLLTADINRDGHLDVVAQDPSDGFAAYFGDGHGGVAAPVPFKTAGAQDLVAGNFDGDADTEIMYLTRGSVSTCDPFLTGLSTGDVFCVGLAHTSVPPDTYRIHLEDADGDGIQRFDNRPAITASFDFDGDGRPDSVKWLRSTGGVTVTFADPNFAAGLGSPQSVWLLGSSTNGDVRLTDINGDGRLDVTFTNDASACYWSWDTSFRSFRLTVVSQDPSQPFSGLHWEDFNHDGFEDVVGLGDYFGYTGSAVSLNDGTGHFTTTAPWGAVDRVVLGDFNEDGLADALTVAHTGLTILLQDPPPAAPALSFSPEIPSQLNGPATALAITQRYTGSLNSSAPDLFTAQRYETPANRYDGALHAQLGVGDRSGKFGAVDALFAWLPWPVPFYPDITEGPAGFADLNHDGAIDLYSISPSDGLTGCVWVPYAKQCGFNLGRVDYPSMLYATALGDVNRDGLIDGVSIPSISGAPGPVRVEFGNSNFTSTVRYGLMETAFSNDFRRIDSLATAFAIDERGNILLAEPTGLRRLTWSRHSSLDAVYQVTDLAALDSPASLLQAVDIDGDRTSDAIVVNNDVHVYSSRANAVVDLHVGSAVNSVTVADFNRDGYNDIAMLDGTSLIFRIGAGLDAAGRPQFVDGGAVTVTAGAHLLTSGEVDGDGAPDLVFAIADQPLVSTLLNTTAMAGSVQFEVDGQPIGDPVPVRRGEASASITGLAKGSHSITARFSGFGSLSSSETTSTLVLTGIDTTTTLQTSGGAAVVGQAVTFSASVSGADGVPTGSITFIDGAQTLGVVPLDSSGNASFITSNLSAGAHAIAAVYSGDVMCFESTSSALAVSVDRGQTLTTLASSNNPATEGDAITFTVSVAAADATAMVPSGSVKLIDLGQQLGVANLVDGQASFTLSNLGVTPHAIAAEFSGDENFNASTSMQIAQVIQPLVVPDHTPPQLTLPANVAVTVAAKKTNAIVTFAASAIDLVDGPLAVNCAPASGSTFPLGATTVNCSAADAAGNIGTGAFTVTVIAAPKPPPIPKPVVQVPEPIRIEATGPDGALVVYEATATDATDGVIAVSCAPASGGTFPIGRTQVSCSATNSGGKTDTASFNVVVRDTTDPVIVSVTPSATTLPPTGLMVPVTMTVNVTDIVDMAPSCAVIRVGSSVKDATKDGVPDWSITGPLTVSLEAATRKNRDRTYTITVRCEDAAGNRTKEKSVIVVSKM